MGNNLHKALTGCSNQQTLRNIKFLASYVKYREELPFLVVSTLLVPGYIDEKEVFEVALFIASLDKNIAYSLLGFYPQFFMSDLKPTTRQFTNKCTEAAFKAG